MRGRVIWWGIVWWVLRRGAGWYCLLRRAGISNGGVFCCRHGDEQQQRRGGWCDRMEPGVAALLDGATHGQVWPVGLGLFLLEKLTMYVEEQQVLVIIT